MCSSCSVPGQRVGPLKKTKSYSCMWMKYNVMELKIKYFSFFIVNYNKILKYAPNLLNRGILNDAWEAHRASCFCDITRVCRSLVRKHITGTHVELDHGRGGAKSRAGCPPSES